VSENHYAVLGLQPSADQDAVKRAYRRLIRQCHPDLTDDPEAPAAAARIIAAYEILGDPTRRARYDNDPFRILQGFDWNGTVVLWRVGFGYRTEWCMHCGRDLHRGVYSPTFRSKRRDALYDSNACRQAAYRARRAAMKRLDAGEP
jgi:curved DNA-binding protein CbpA